MDSAAWKQAFYAMDQNNDGYVDYQEFIGACVDNHEVLNKENLEELFRSSDLDGDGRLSVQELKAVF